MLEADFHRSDYVPSQAHQRPFSKRAFWTGEASVPTCFELLILYSMTMTCSINNPQLRQVRISRKWLLCFNASSHFR
jgi:hypothetical protein